VTLELTDRQEQVLDWIREYIAINRIPPTRAELAQAFGWKSTNAADQHIRALHARGAIELIAGIARGIVLPTTSESRTRK